MNRSAPYTAVAALSSVATIGVIVYVVNAGDLRPGLDQVLMLLAGFLTMAAMTFAFWFLGEADTSRVVRFRLSEPMLREVLARVGTDLKIPDKSPRVELTPWEPTLGQLVGVDNALAMAKLRMELERELRRIAHTIGIDIQSRPVSLARLSSELEIRQILPTEIAMVIRDLLAVSNQAIHGVKITDDQAASTARLGADVLDLLRHLPQAVDPSTSERPRSRLIDLE